METVRRPLYPLISAFVLALVLILWPSLPHAEARSVVVAVSADPEHFNPGITTGSHTHSVSNSLFNGLVARDRSNRPIPDLAERWSISQDGMTYSFFLSEARWHDGQPVTSADVKFTFESILIPYHARTGASLRNRIISIETPDSQTVVFRLSAPYAPLLQQLDVTEAPILPAHVFRGSDPHSHPANFAPIGSGPFRLVRYIRDDITELVRNSDYFKPGLPKIERLFFRVIPDARTALLAYQAGEIDVLRSIGGNDAQTLARRQDTVIEAVTSGPGGGNCMMTVVFNLDRLYLADRRVREAFALSINRARMVQDILFGRGRVADAPIASGIGWAHAAGSLSSYEYDPAKAAALLVEAGHTTRDRRLRLEIVHFPQFGRYADSMRQDLGRVGIDLVSRPVDRAATVDAIYMKRDFDTALISYCHGLDPEIGFRRTLASDAIGPVPFSNGSAYRNDEIDSLFAQAVATTDLEMRGEIYRSIQSIAARDLPYWWLVETESLSAFRSNLSGFTMWSGQFAESAGAR